MTLRAILRRSLPPSPPCDVCCSSESILNCDTVHQMEGISAHYFCLLFSSGLGQKGEEKVGVKGFLAADIRREVRRGTRLKCEYCTARRRDPLWRPLSAPTSIIFFYTILSGMYTGGRERPGGVIASEWHLLNFWTFECVFRMFASADVSSGCSLLQTCLQKCLSKMWSESKWIKWGTLECCTLFIFFTLRVHPNDKNYQLNRERARLPGESIR